MVADKKKIQKKKWANNFKKKTETLKETDPKAYDERIQKMKTSTNRRSRVYQRRRRVGNNPKKMSARIRKIFKILYSTRERANVTENVMTRDKDLDAARKSFRGTLGKEFLTAGDTIDLLVELVGMMVDNQIHFKTKYQKKISLRFRNDTITIPWPKNGTNPQSMSFTSIIIQGKKFYHNYWKPLVIPEGFGYEIIPMREVLEHCDEVRLDDFLEEFGLSIADLQH